MLCDGPCIMIVQCYDCKVWWFFFFFFFGCWWLIKEVWVDFSLVLMSFLFFIVCGFVTLTSMIIGLMVYFLHSIHGKFLKLWNVYHYEIILTAYMEFSLVCILPVILVSMLFSLYIICEFFDAAAFLFRYEDIFWFPFLWTSIFFPSPYIMWLFTSMIIT